MSTIQTISSEPQQVNQNAAPANGDANVLNINYIQVSIVKENNGLTVSHRREGDTYNADGKLGFREHRPSTPKGYKINRVIKDVNGIGSFEKNNTTGIWAVIYQALIDAQEAAKQEHQIEHNLAVSDRELEFKQGKVAIDNLKDKSGKIMGLAILAKSISFVGDVGGAALGGYGSFNKSGVQLDRGLTVGIEGAGDALGGMVDAGDEKIKTDEEAEEQQAQLYSRQAEKRSGEFLGSTDSALKAMQDILREYQEMEQQHNSLLSGQNQGIRG